MQIYVEPTTPYKSKPLACNYGLKWAVGEYVTIYNAEDHPDPLQLQKVLQAFDQADDDLSVRELDKTTYQMDKGLYANLCCTYA